jgi:putative ABC transport system permease protein
LAGIYPAFLLSRQKSVESLKGKLETVKEKILLRHSLIGIQFVTAIVVFIAAIVIDKQVNFFLEKDLGYIKDRVITAKVPRDWSPQGVQHMATIRDEFSRLPEVEAASFSFEIPDGASASMNNVVYRASADSSTGVLLLHLYSPMKNILLFIKYPLLQENFLMQVGAMPIQRVVVINEVGSKGPGLDRCDQCHRSAN